MVGPDDLCDLDDNVADIFEQRLCVLRELCFIACALRRTRRRRRRLPVKHRPATSLRIEGKAEIDRASDHAAARHEGERHLVPALGGAARQRQLRIREDARDHSDSDVGVGL